MPYVTFCDPLNSVFGESTLKTVSDFEADITDATFALRAAKSDEQKDKLRHRISYARKRLRELRELTGTDDRPLTSDEIATMDYAEFRARTPLALLEVIDIPEQFRDQVDAELAEERRQMLLKHPGVAMAKCSDSELAQQMETTAAEARAVQAEEAANGKA